MSCDHAKILNLAGQGKWDEAHKLVQPCSDKISYLIHAYLHRVEGDTGNAGYWYRRAGVVAPDNTLAEELTRLQDMINERGNT